MAAPRIVSAASASAVKIESPFDGAILNRRHGKSLADGLSIPVVCAAPASAKVTINGRAARREGDKFVGEVVLRREGDGDRRRLRGEGDGRGEDRVRVVWDRYSRPRYHFAVDDNIYFLRDIARKKYASLFDCFYLKTFRDLHRKYGTRFSVNIYFAADDGFTLPQFPDRYKSEWKDNAGWLKLAFHAYADTPGPAVPGRSGREADRATTTRWRSRSIASPGPRPSPRRRTCTGPWPRPRA